MEKNIIFVFNYFMRLIISQQNCRKYKHLKETDATRKSVVLDFYLNPSATSSSPINVANHQACRAVLVSIIKCHSIINYPLTPSRKHNSFPPQPPYILTIFSIASSRISACTLSKISIGRNLTALSPDPPILTPTVLAFFKNASRCGLSNAMNVPCPLPLRLLNCPGYFAANFSIPAYK